MYHNYIDGEWVPSSTGETIRVENPADSEEVVAEVQRSNEDDARDAINAATEASADWAAMPGPSRGEILTETARLLDEQSEDLTELLVREEGKTLPEARGEVGRAIDIFEYYGQKAADYGGTVKQSSGRETTLYTVKEPLGVAALITPWNYPIAIPAWKLAPALATGNTAVLKPSPLAPTVAHELVECLDAAGVPDGVVNIVTGAEGEVGKTLVSHEGVDAVSFTGSVEVGQEIHGTAAANQKRVQTEMGGKNATIVADDADVSRAADIVGSGAFGVTGQACTACSRALVHESILDEFVDEIVDYAEGIEVGPGLEDYDMGPQITARELDTTCEYIEVASTEGATLETGGDRLTGERFENGHFVEPTVFSNVDRDMRIAQEEVFGPVLSVIAVENFEEAMEIANDTDYGLSASIVTDSHSKAQRFVSDIETGVAKVNDKTTGLELHVPFGGVKHSSSNTHREQGDAGIDFFTTTKTVYDTF
jgi:aldehyde dehydrogenase (NAD+)